MRKKLFNLSKKEREELENKYREERDKRIAQRILCILLLHGGKSAKEVAIVLMVRVKTIKRWIKIFTKFGIHGLCTLNYKNNGAVCELNNAQIEELKTFLNSEIRSSTKEVMSYIEKTFGVKYTENGVLRLLRRLGYRYRKPAIIPAKADYEKQAEFIARYEEKRREIEEDGKIYFMDASHFLHNAVAGYGWIEKGKNIEIKTNSGRDRLNILGAYSPDEGDIITIETTESCASEKVKSLLRKIREANPKRKQIVIVLDNARYQHTKEVKDLAVKLNIELLYLPAYSPNLNLIERFWKFMKQKITKNKYYPTFNEFVLVVKNFLQNAIRYKEELNSLITNGASLQAKFSNRKTDEAILIRLKAMPLHQEVKSGHCKGQG